MSKFLLPMWHQIDDNILQCKRPNTAVPLQPCGKLCCKIIIKTRILIETVFTKYYIVFLQLVWWLLEHFCWPYF